MKNDSFRILAEGQLISNDTRATGINNNDLILGPSGAGKTRGYVKPNLLQADGSVVVADTKGSLVQEVGPVMAAHGYKVVHLDFTDLAHSPCGYNPLEFIRRDPQTRRYSEQDILTAAGCLAPVGSVNDPFWDLSAQMYLASMIGYVLECLPRQEHTLEAVADLFQLMDDPSYDEMFQSLGMKRPGSHAYRLYRMIRKGKGSEKTHASIQMILTQALSSLSFGGALRFYQQEERIDFAALGREKTAVFLTVSDTDRAMDKLVDLFYTQAICALCAYADRDCPGHRLPVPVRFILDDFATNIRIPGFDKLISVIRSREISVSVILQSLSQLEALYGKAQAMTIINNCDNCLYLGGQDVDTARYISVKVNRPVDAVLNMPLGDAYLFTRGRKPRQVRKFDLRAHPCYHELPEARMEREAACAASLSAGQGGPGL